MAAICLAIGFMGGYEYGVRQPKPTEVRDIKQMKNVLVVDVHRPGSMTMERSDGLRFETDFCLDSPEGKTLEAGQLLTEFNFNQRADCKSIVGLPSESLGFAVYSEHGQRVKLPIGEIANAR